MLMKFKMSIIQKSNKTFDYTIFISIDTIYIHFEKKTILKSLSPSLDLTIKVTLDIQNLKCYKLKIKQDKILLHNRFQRKNVHILIRFKKLRDH